MPSRTSRTGSSSATTRPRPFGAPARVHQRNVPVYTLTKIDERQRQGARAEHAGRHRTTSARTRSPEHQSISGLAAARSARRGGQGVRRSGRRPVLRRHRGRVRRRHDPQRHGQQGRRQWTRSPASTSTPQRSRSEVRRSRARATSSAAGRRRTGPVSVTTARRRQPVGAGRPPGEPAHERADRSDGRARTSGTPAIRAATSTLRQVPHSTRSWRPWSTQLYGLQIPTTNRSDLRAIFHQGLPGSNQFGNGVRGHASAQPVDRPGGEPEPVDGRRDGQRRAGRTVAG